MATLLDESEIAERLLSLPGWLREGNELKRQFSFPQYLDGIAFAGRVGHLAETENHHPDMLIRWRKVSVSFSTHSAGGLTALDFKLAHQVDALYQS